MVRPRRNFPEPQQTPGFHVPVPIPRLTLCTYLPQSTLLSWRPLFRGRWQRPRIDKGPNLAASTSNGGRWRNTKTHWRVIAWKNVKKTYFSFFFLMLRRYNIWLKHGPNSQMLWHLGGRFILLSYTSSYTFRDLVRVWTMCPIRENI